MIKLRVRDYQKEIIRQLWSNFNNYKVQIIQAPTGAGKSVIMTTGLKLLLRRIEKNANILIVSPRLEINSQLEDYLIKLNIIQHCSIITNLNRKILKNIEKYDYMVVDECFSPHTLIRTETGYRKIRDIKINDLVYSYNKSKKEFELKKVVRLFNKNYADNFIKLNLNNSLKYGIDGTKNHKFYTLEGQKRADELQLNDYIISMPRFGTSNNNIGFHFNKQQEQVLIGSYFGDGCLIDNRMRLVHGEKQYNYLSWKKAILSNLTTQNNFNINKSGYQPNNKIYCFSTNKLIYLSEFSLDYCLKKLDILGLAIWFMDDGSLCNKNYSLSTCSFTLLENQLIQKTFKDKFNFKGKIKLEKRCNKYYFTFNREETRTISFLIREFVIESMQYKLLDIDKNKFNFKIDKFLNFGLSKITRIQEIKKYNNNLVYNIEVEDNHNYLVGNNLLVSNCHHFQAKTYKNIWSKADINCKLFGFTATPKTDKLHKFNEKLCGLFAHFIKDGCQKENINFIKCKYQTKELIQQGNLSKFLMIAEYKIVEKIIEKARNIKSIMLREQSFTQIVGMIPRYKILNSLKNSKKAVAFCNSIAYCLELKEYLNNNGISAELLVSDTDDYKLEQDRGKINNDFKYGDTRVLLGVNIFNEGYDCPIIDTALMLRPTNSLIIYLQQVGRALRPSKTKDITYIYDFVGNGAYFGSPDSDWEWEKEFWLEKDPKEKFLMDKIPAKECPVCSNTMSGNSVRECPYCHFDFYKWNTILGKEIYLKELWEKTTKIKENEIKLTEKNFIKQTKNLKGTMLHLLVKGQSFYWCFYKTNFFMHKRMLKQINEICYFQDPHIGANKDIVFYKCKNKIISFNKKNSFNYIDEVKEFKA